MATFNQENQEVEAQINVIDEITIKQTMDFRELYESKKKHFT